MKVCGIAMRPIEAQSKLSLRREPVDTWRERGMRANLRREPTL